MNSYIVASNPNEFPTCFYKQNVEVIKITPEGCIFWKGREVESDVEFKQAMLDLKTYLKPDNSSGWWMKVPKPLTPKLISLGNNCHKYFLEGIRFAEDMHGITGVDDE